MGSEMCIRDSFGTAFSILKNLFGEGDYNSSIPKFDGMMGAIISISFSLIAFQAQPGRDDDLNSEVSAYNGKASESLFFLLSHKRERPARLEMVPLARALLSTPRNQGHDGTSFNQGTN